jgi:hypothetical protein
MTSDDKNNIERENAAVSSAAFSAAEADSAHSPGKSVQSVFFMSASDRQTAEAYWEMLKKHGVAVLFEDCGPSGRVAAYKEAGGAAPAAALKVAPNAPVNLYVPSYQLERARELADAFENGPFVYNTPPPVLNRKSISGRLIFALVIFLVFLVPIGLSLYIIGERIVRFFAR